jgi:membrane protease YdiL (CAAX protease family)
LELDSSLESFDEIAPPEAPNPLSFGGLERPDPESLPPWGMYAVAVSLGIGYILIPLLVSNVMLLVNPFMSPVGELFMQQAVTLITWLLIFGWLRFRYGPIKAYLGLTVRRPFGYYSWETVKLLLLTSSLTLLLNQMWVFLDHRFPAWWLMNQGEPYSDYNTPQLVMLSVFAVLMAPVLEEVIFRGLVQSTFHKISPPLRSVIFTCLMFLLFHGTYFDNIKALSHVLVLGLCFGFWRERTKSLMPGMAVHLFNNGLASIILLLRH